MDPRSRYHGSLLGLAVGDALGTTLEFQPPGTFEPITDITGGGPFQVPAGAWTDDTSMALCLAESLIACRGFDPVHQLQTYCRWWQEGHLSSTGRCFDVGGTTRRAFADFRLTGNPASGPTDPRSAGNGSIMRLAPVPLAFAADPRTAISRAADSSRTTHGAVECMDACRYLASLIVGALAGVPKDELLATRYSPIARLWEESPLAPKVATVAAGSFRDRQPPAIRGTGYVVQSLEAALWAFYHSDNFRDGALMAVNLGDDADTTGAVYGQLAGAYYGEEGIPAAWRERLVVWEKIVELADGLLNLSLG